MLERARARERERARAPARGQPRGGCSHGAERAGGGARQEGADDTRAVYGANYFDVVSPPPATVPPPPVLLPSPSAPLPPVLLGRRADGGRKYDSFWARGATQRGVQLCAVCGFAAPYTCRVTGMRLCSKGCFKVHGETQLKGQ